MTFFGKYNPAAHGWEANKNIVSFAYKGVPFPAGVNSRVARLFVLMLDALVPKIPAGLHEGWNWGYANRNTTEGSALSFHAFGLALDLNAPVNPYKGSDMSYHPNWGANFVLPQNTGSIVKDFGMEWGGDWTSPHDFMHIEIHLTPTEVDALIKKLTDGKPHVPVFNYESYKHVQLGTRVLNLGNAGDDVKRLQDILNHWYPKRTPLVEDGYFGLATRDAVKYFQTQAKIGNRDGIFGQVTAAALGINWTAHHNIFPGRKG